MDLLLLQEFKPFILNIRKVLIIIIIMFYSNVYSMDLMVKRGNTVLVSYSLPSDTSYLEFPTFKNILGVPLSSWVLSWHLDKGKILVVADDAETNGIEEYRCSVPDINSFVLFDIDKREFYILKKINKF